MSCQLHADCLTEIFECLEEDKVTLHSCLLVNHFWCEVSVRILWRNLENLENWHMISNTLIACLPDESMDLLYKNDILISIQPSRPPLFNYVSFCKALSVYGIDCMILENQTIDIDFLDLVKQEILKMFMNQSSLKKLYCPWSNLPNFTQFPGARDCLTGLSKFSCRSNIPSEFCYQLSQICHNIRSLHITIIDTISNGLEILISSQNRLNRVSLFLQHNRQNREKIAPLLMRCSNTLIKLKVKCDFRFGYCFYFGELQYVTFPQFQILKFQGPYSPDDESLIKFLEINGKNLKEFHADTCINNSVSLAIAKWCPNLKSLCSYFFYEDTLKMIFHSCEQLEKIEISNEYQLKNRHIFEIVANHSSNNLEELELYSGEWSELHSKDLESFFVSWKNRIPQKPLSFIVVVENLSSLGKFDDIMKVIEKYKKLGVVKKFEVKNYSSGKK